MYQSKVCVQVFSYFVSGLDIQLENPSTTSTTVLYAKKLFTHLPFFPCY